MSEPNGLSVSTLDARGKRKKGKQRTLTDALLISAWVATYAGVLAVFRVAGLIESLTANRRE